jgi:hypothetical protein
MSLSKTEMGPESVILQLANSRSQCTSVLSDDLLLKIKTIRDSIGKQDGTDSQLGWRRGHSQPMRGGGTSTDWRSGYRPSGSHHRSDSSRNGSGNGGNNGQHQRYVSRFRNNETPVQETILNQVILNKLNKFSEVNYEDVKQFLKQILDSNDTVFLKEFMQLVFRKAASEPTFCPLYARLICELSKAYNSLLSEFEVLYKDYLTIFDDIDESKCPDYETFVKRNKERLYRLGYSQFLAELISKGVLKSDDLILLFSKILEQVSNASRESKDKVGTVDEYIQCILRMAKALKNTEIAQTLQCFEEPIEYLIQNQASEFPGLSKKSVFGLMDCLDILRKNV